MRPIPFKAALFDLDGTLLDSMHVWADVDRTFFTARGLSVPEAYGLAVAGMSFRETAQYTVDHYAPDESCESVIQEWTRLAELEYAYHVRLKDGWLSYLRMLKREGVKLAVATALSPALYEPCLENLGIRSLFDACCSTNDTGGRGKQSGEVYLLAAERLGVKPEDCAVFEDVYPGILGAKRVGMRAYCMREQQSASQFGQIAEIADGMLDTAEDMRAYHDFPPAARCVIFTAHCEGDPARAYAPRGRDWILCADGGWRVADAIGAPRHITIGDFDSSAPPETGEVLRYPPEKDDTDTCICVKYALSKGYEDFLIVGGFGGRMDHMFGNLQLLKYIAVQGGRAEMRDEKTCATVIVNGSIVLPAQEGKFSVFALDAVCAGVSIRGAKYPLSSVEMTNSYPIGVSNEFKGNEVEVSVEAGALLIVIARD